MGIVKGAQRACGPLLAWLNDELAIALDSRIMQSLKQVVWLLAASRVPILCLWRAC